MKHPQEDIARKLHKQMNSKFAEFSPTIDGAGVHWQCKVQNKERECEIDCFNYPKKIEYYTTYQEKGETLAYSRHPSSTETLEAVADWLTGTDLPTLYQRYHFIDERKRQLTRIREQALASEPELENSAKSELTRQMSDIHYLYFNGNNRSCQISFYGDNQYPNALFSWDDCALFEYQPKDYRQLAHVLKHWLCDTAAPSAMRREFPWLKIGKLADYYENGNPIEGEFLMSWDNIEHFYQEMDVPFKSQVMAFLDAMRNRDYDRKFRAGQSMWSLILSRSRRHGLRVKQKSIQFWFHKDGMEVLIDGAGMIDLHTGENVYLEKINCPTIELTPEIIVLADQLAEAPID